MKNKDQEQLKLKSTTEIKKFISDRKKAKVIAVIDLKVAKVKNVHLVRTISKDIAQAKTILESKLFLERSKNENAAS